MRIGIKGLEIERYFEGIHDGDLHEIGLQPKMDCSGNWTEGFGHAIFHQGKILNGAENKELANKLSVIKTVEEAEIWMQKDNDVRSIKVEKRLKRVLKQHQFDALMSFYYNAGFSPTIFALINKGDAYISDLVDFWTKHYIRSGGEIKNGLVKRRCTEANLYLTGNVDFDAWENYYDKLF